MRAKLEETWVERNPIWATAMMLVAFALCAIAVWVSWSYMESKTYNHLTGAQTTTWDAMWVELRVQSFIPPPLPDLELRHVEDSQPESDWRRLNPMSDMLIKDAIDDLTRQVIACKNSIRSLIVAQIMSDNPRYTEEQIKHHLENVFAVRDHTWPE